MPLSPEQFIPLLNGGHETRAVEFKSAGPRTDPVLFALVTRAVLAMSNLPLGGWVILGLKDDGALAGMNSFDLATWEEHDEVTAAFNAFADPFAQVEVQQALYEGQVFLVLRVKEFEEVPVLARK